MRAFRGITIKPVARLGHGMARGMATGRPDFKEQKERRESQALVQDVDAVIEEELILTTPRPTTRDDRARESAQLDRAAVRSVAAARAERVSVRSPAPTPLMDPQIRRTQTARQARTAIIPTTTTRPSRTSADPAVRRVQDARNRRRR